MYAFGNWHWSVLAVAFSLATPAVQAGMITPDSIPNPPSAVGSASGTQVYASNLVNTQYASSGLNFSSGAAITSLNGQSIWAPTEPVAQPMVIGPGGPPVNPPLAAINYSDSLAGKLVSPGSSNPTTVSSLSVETFGQAGLSMSVYGLNGQPLNITPAFDPILIVGNSGMPSGMILSFTGSGISSFSVAMIPPPTPIVSGSSGEISSAWGIGEVSFTPASAPEPSSLILAGLGALGLAARLGWRRTRTVA